MPLYLVTPPVFPNHSGSVIDFALLLSAGMQLTAPVDAGTNCAAVLLCCRRQHMLPPQQLQRSHLASMLSQRSKTGLGIRKPSRRLMQLLLSQRPLLRQLASSRP